MIQNIRYITGVDEVGRGPVAGPLLVAAVVVSKTKKIKVYSMLKDIQDSKQLSEKKREEWFVRLKEMRSKKLLDWRCAFVAAKMIDQRGIAYALKITVRRALKYLDLNPDKTLVLLDGSLYAPRQFVHQKTIIKGEEKEKLIATAAIVAKVNRDRRMQNYAKKFPEYGFEEHKGYGTKKHLDAIKKHGMCKLHRRSFVSR